MKAADQNSSLFCQSEDRSMKKLSSVNTAESAIRDLTSPPSGAIMNDRCELQAL